MSQPDNDDAPDVIPEFARGLLISMWLLLFGGRWLITPVLQWMGVLSPEKLEQLDGRLLILYWVLLIATLAIALIVAVLRLVRGAQAHSGPISVRSDAASFSASPDAMQASPKPTRQDREDKNL